MAAVLPKREDHMHQTRRLLRYIDPELFWDKFRGKPGEGRCGWSYYPPTACETTIGQRNYILTDIEDWRPTAVQNSA
jgi:hypothetical protein